MNGQALANLSRYMKTIITILIVFGLLIDTKSELGLGVIQVDIYKTTEIKVYRNKGDKSPEKIIRLVNKDGEINIEEHNYSNWLKPEAIWLDYSQFLFRYTAVEDKWIQIIVNTDTKDKKWIQKSQTLTIQTWENFLINETTAIDPLGSTDIKTEPNTNSTTLRKSTDKDCFEAIEIKGDWIKIKTNETLDCNEHPQPMKSGWIKWKENNQLSIKYFLTC